VPLKNQAFNGILLAFTESGGHLEDATTVLQIREHKFAQQIEGAL
jgi:hypothetical protein